MPKTCRYPHLSAWETKMKLYSSILLLVLTSLIGTTVNAQNGVTKEIELGALVTSGNTDEKSLNFAGAIDIIEDSWEYNFSLDGLYSSSESEVKGQRFYGVARAKYSFSDDSNFISRISHEDDRFSGFDSQSDITFSYGRGLLKNIPNMELEVNAGVGVRWSRVDNSDFDEPIVRFAGDYNWVISESAVFSQSLSAEAGSDSNIYRSETTIETEIMDNLSLRFSLNIKNQSDVPVGREKTDTKTAVTLVLHF